MCKLHGVRLVKGIKIFESMLKKPAVTSNKTAWTKFSTFHCSSIITLYLRKFKYIQVESSPVFGLRPLMFVHAKFSVNV